MNLLHVFVATCFYMCGDEAKQLERKKLEKHDCFSVRLMFVCASKTGFCLLLGQVQGALAASLNRLLPDKPHQMCYLTTCLFLVFLQEGWNHSDFFLNKSRYGLLTGMWFLSLSSAAPYNYLAIGGACSSVWSQLELPVIKQGITCFQSVFLSFPAKLVLFYCCNNAANYLTAWNGRSLSRCTFSLEV